MYFPEYLPYFAAGAIFFDIWQGREQRWRWPALAILVALCMREYYASHGSYVGLMMLTATFVPFVLLCRAPRTLRVLECTPLVWLGRRSYSLYLLHQNIGVALISLAAAGLSLGTHVLINGAETQILVVVSHLVYELVERRTDGLARWMTGRRTGSTTVQTSA